MPVIPALGRLKQEVHKFEASLGYIIDPISKRKKIFKKMITAGPNFVFICLHMSEIGNFTYIKN
jgi:hypothetical protein